MTQKNKREAWKNTLYFICPVCGGPLARRGGACVCPRGHSYDMASEGYLYLLPPNQKHAKIPGDSRQMVAARRRFLETGNYEVFSDALNRLALEAVRGKKEPAVLDAGCGEGYYTARLADFLEQSGLRARIAGLDISKSAVRAAAKRHGGLEFAVGSNFHIPASSGSADCLLSVFSPLVPEEFFRVLRPGGTMILAVPGPRHLFGLKEILYEEPYENEYKDTQYEGFDFEKRVDVGGKIAIDGNNTILDLFAMTPYYWKTPEAGSERLKQADRLETEIGFGFLVYRKRQAG